jgi:hypothetical protein
VILQEHPLADLLLEVALELGVAVDGIAHVMTQPVDHDLVVDVESVKRNPQVEQITRPLRRW